MKILLVLFLLLSFPALAVLPDEMLKDPVLEARAREISRDLRCVVCQGQAVDDSPAEIAGDIRRFVRARLEKGDTDAEILSQVRERYGDAVLMRPPLQGSTMLLWFTPVIVLAAGALWVRAAVRGRG